MDKDTASCPLKKFVVNEVDRNMKDDSLGDVTLIKKPDVIKAALSRPHNVYETEVWNKAIEAAAVSLTKWYPSNSNTNAFCAAIRSLKK